MNKNEIKPYVLLVLSVLAVLSFSTISEGQQKDAVLKGDLKLYDGPPQGIWRALAVAIQQSLQKNIPELRVSIEPGGGASNIIAVNREPALGIVMANAAYDGFMGDAPFKEKAANIREVAVLYPMYFMTFTKASSNINKIEDLRGKRVQVTPKGYASELISKMVLSEYGMTYKDISPQFLGETQGGEALKDGHIDAFMVTAGIDYPPLLDVMSSAKVNIFTISRDVVQRLHQKNRGLAISALPANTYKGFGKSLPTIEAPSAIIANKDLSDDLVEKVTRVLVDTLQDRQKMFSFTRGLTKKDLALDLGIPFHPGAMKYYKAQGWMK